MPTDIDPRISPSLFPGNVNKLVDYNDDTASSAAGTESVLKSAYEGIRQVWDARATVEKNTAWHWDQKTIKVGTFAEGKAQQIAKPFEFELINLEKQIDHFEKELTAPVEAKAGDFLASEIRAHAKTMDRGNRFAFVQQAIKDGDEMTVSCSVRPATCQA